MCESLGTGQDRSLASSSSKLLLVASMFSLSTSVASQIHRPVDWIAHL